ncbi:failed axon connections-like [Montipora capricornis]|uniref:failed axon connections-like n=1 Tax=Montipora capricornis TaxID=246305 RepID=UPI0035F20830
MATEVESPALEPAPEEVETKPEGEAKPEENHVEEKQDEQTDQATDENKAAEPDANAVNDSAKPEENGTSQPKVLIYQHPPWNNIPSPLPACIKIETYCRLMKIPYENVFKAGTDQKLPYIEYQGETKKHNLISFLNSKFEVDADASLTDKDKALSRAFQCMVEENTFWSLMYYRWVDNFAETKKYFKGLDVVRKNVRPKLDQGKCVKCLEAHEIGKNNKDDIYAIGVQDLKAISAFLDDKEFFLGSEPSTIDCTLFGLLSCLLNTAENSPLTKVVTEDLKNLVNLYDRMKLNYWLDWNELCSEEQVEETRPKSRLSVKKKRRTKPTEPAAEEKGAEVSAEKEGEEKKEEESKPEEAAAAEGGESAQATTEEPKEQAEAAEEKKDEETPVVNGDASEEPAAEPAQE